MKTYITPKVKVFAVVSHHIMSGSIPTQDGGTYQSKEDDDFDFGY